MSKSIYWVEYAETWRRAPLAYWVHIEQDGQPWFKAERFLPPAPDPVPHKGFPVLCVEFEGLVLRFSSEPQLLECVRVLEQTPLPTSRRLSAARGGTYGPNGHWLSRLPAAVKSPRTRARLVDMLKQVLLAKPAPEPSVGRTRA
jgi:hypothetical protein